MTTENAKMIFNSEIAKETDKNRIAKLELLREYFTNSDFKLALENEVARLTGCP